MSKDRQTTSIATVAERPAAFSGNGYLALIAVLLLAIAAVGSVAIFFTAPHAGLPVYDLVRAVLFAVLGVFLLSGIYTLAPNENAVLVLFGTYKGVDNVSGLRFANPFCSIHKVSKRIASHECATLKVNDKIGNPIEIAAVVIWRVVDSAKALLQMDDYKAYLAAQIETSLRHIAQKYPYDFAEVSAALSADGGTQQASPTATLRESGDEIMKALVTELRQRLSVAGVEVDEARITHLTYAPEIAPSMLRRQQAAATLDARRTIVNGAVGIVSDALAEIAKKEKIEIDPERKAAMISNLLVVLVSDGNVSPVINTGTLYA